ncbi:unnamed protein product [Paramecium primaurelia]|uniref:Uncharacterized protein n=1 Tax=Paramecium primaurelia TaxID=5886 RepID=A0A8S1PK64_PARPR|nr:unnamed protein product [Paramecium primaurelia]
MLAHRNSILLQKMQIYRRVFSTFLGYLQLMQSKLSLLNFHQKFIVQIIQPFLYDITIKFAIIGRYLSIQIKFYYKRKSLIQKMEDEVSAKVPCI